MLKSNQNKNNLFTISAQERLGVVHKQKEMYIAIGIGYRPKLSWKI